MICSIILITVLINTELKQLDFHFKRNDYPKNLSVNG
jgi:hypothetical protein